MGRKEKARVGKGVDGGGNIDRLRTESESGELEGLIRINREHKYMMNWTGLNNNCRVTMRVRCDAGTVCPVFINS